MTKVNQPHSGVEGKVATTESGNPQSGWTTKYPEAEPQGTRAPVIEV